jgi:hypothetical protein
VNCPHAAGHQRPEVGLIGLEDEAGKLAAIAVFADGGPDFVAYDVNPVAGGWPSTLHGVAEAWAQRLAGSRA